MTLGRDYPVFKEEQVGKVAKIMIYYVLFVGGIMISQINTVLLYKKYQMTAGTDLWANIIYMIINGIVSAAFSGAIIFFSKGVLQVTLYSLLFATATVISAAVGLICTLKVYERGQIAIVNILVTIGGIVLPCLWGILFLKENLSLQEVIAIIIMLCAVTFILEKKSKEFDGKQILMCVVIILCNCLVTILGKQHQVETAYETVDTLSYSVWVGVIRTVLFLGLGLVFLGCKKGKCGFLSISKTAFYASLSSVASAGSYIITLFTATVLPIVITSPLSAGLGMIMTSFLPWLIYHEKLTKRMWIGFALGFIGVLLFLT